LNLVFLATTVFAVIGFIFAPLLVPIMAPGLGEDVGRQAELRSLAVDLTRIMMLSPIFFSVSGMFMGTLNARHHFIFPAIAPWTYNLSIIIAALVADNVEVLAVGVVVGSALHLFVQLPALRMVGMVWYQSPIGAMKASARRLAFAPRPQLAACNQLSNHLLRFHVSDEAISAVNYAWLITTPLSFGMAISTAVFRPCRTAAAENNESPVFASLRLILFSRPKRSDGAGKPLVTFLFSSAFTESSTDITVGAHFRHRPCRAEVSDPRRGYPSLILRPSQWRSSMVANLILCLILVNPFVRGSRATFLSAILELYLLFRVLRRRIRGLDGGSLTQRSDRRRSGPHTEAIGVYIILLHHLWLRPQYAGDAFLALVVAVPSALPSSSSPPPLSTSKSSSSSARDSLCLNPWRALPAPAKPDAVTYAGGCDSDGGIV
jgi:peptidoglycan biosynthesis protein MviN/MurJ (putative lipid II flippase)